MRSNRKLKATVFGKENNNDIYLRWRSFASMTWKKGTLRALGELIQFIRMMIFCRKNYTI